LSDQPIKKIVVKDDGARGDEPSLRWWNVEDDQQAADAMVRSAEIIEEDQRPRARLALLYARLYTNQMMDSLYQLGTVRPTVAPSFDTLGHRVTYNVAQAVVDTAAAKISKNRPRALFMTMGGNYDKTQMAKGLTKFVDGIFYETDFYEQVFDRCFTDCAIFDSGISKVYADRGKKKIHIERVLPTELLVNDAEAIYGRPRSIYQRKWVDRDVLASEFGGKDPEKIARIKGADGGDPLKSISLRATDMIPVYEGYHLGSGDTPGAYRIAIKGCSLVRKAWDKDYFPFPQMNWNLRPVGFWGQGLVEQVVGLQLEINKLQRVIAAAQHLMSVPRIFVESGSEIISATINNEIGAILEYTGTMPTQAMWQAVLPELYQRLETLFQKAFEITGISQLSASSKKPEGLDAGVAINAYHDIETERFVKVGQRSETFVLKNAEQVVDLARELESVSVLSPGTHELEQIAWKDVNLTRDQFVMRQYPTSLLPTMPAFKLQAVQDIQKSGLLTDQSPGGIWARQMLDFPDMEEFMSVQNEAYTEARWLITNIVEHGKYDPPEPSMNLQLLLQMAQSAKSKAKRTGVPEKRIEYLARLIDECGDLMAPPPQPLPAPPLPMPPQMPMGALPMPLPPVPAPGGALPPTAVPALPSNLPAMPAPTALG
jgi:hypothetical protein